MDDGRARQIGSGEEEGRAAKGGGTARWSMRRSGIIAGNSDGAGYIWKRFDLRREDCLQKRQRVRRACDRHIIKPDDVSVPVRHLGSIVIVHLDMAMDKAVLVAVIRVFVDVLRRQRR